MPFVDNVIAVAEHEWEFFGKDVGDGTHSVGGKPKETVGKFAQRVGDYWLSIPSAEYDNNVKNFAKALGKLDGTVTALPWSAAFISYCMQMAGAGKDFPYSGGHSKWIIKSVKNRIAGREGSALVGYRIEEKPLALGDLVGAPRAEDKGLKYEDIPTKSEFRSHTDFIVEIDLPGRKAFAIGGNVGQSVSRTTLKIDAAGRLADTSRPWFVHIKNNITNLPLPGGKTLKELLNEG